MNCTAARDRMLKADLAELTGTPESDLSLHLRDCASCRESAARIVAAELDLSRALRTAAPRLDVEQAIRRPRVGHRWGWRAVPLAAAATIVSVILLSRDGHPPPTPTSQPFATTPPLEIEVPPGQTAAVMATGNPDIIVIWFY